MVDNQTLNKALKNYGEDLAVASAEIKKVKSSIIKWCMPISNNVG